MYSKRTYIEEDKQKEFDLRLIKTTLDFYDTKPCPSIFSFAIVLMLFLTALGILTLFIANRY